MEVTQEDRDAAEYYGAAIGYADADPAGDILRQAFARHRTTALAAKEAELEGLREVVRVIEDPDQRLCCDGRECGCMGATVGQYAAWAFQDDAAKEAEIAELRAKVERLREVLGRIAGQHGPYSYPFPESGVGYAAWAVLEARASLAETQP